MSIFGGSPKTSKVASYLQAQTSRELYEHYKRTSIPLQNELIEETGVGKSLGTAIKDVNQYTDLQHDAARGSTLRDAQRYGGMTVEQRTADERRNQLSRQKTKAGLGTAVRQTTADRDLGLRFRQIEIMKGIAGDASSGFNTLAGEEAGRNARNTASAAAARGQAMSTAGTIAAAFVLSSEKYKENIIPADTNNLINKLNAIDVMQFNYSQSMHKAGQWFGPIVEQTPEEFTEGDMLNMQNLTGALIATVQQLTQRIEELENR